MIRTTSKGFTLIELMIVIAIIGILAAIAMPQYNTYQKRSRFTEVVLATTQFKTPAEIAVQSKGVTSAADLNAASHGIPPTITSSTAVGQYIGSVTMTSGVIIAIGNNYLDNAQFHLRADIINGAIRWTEVESATDSCMAIGYC